MIEEDDERKDRYDNLINLIKTMNANYINCMRKIVEYRYELLNSNANKEELKAKHENQRRKFEQKFRSLRELLKKMYKEMIVNHQKTNKPLNLHQELQSLDEKDKCFQQLGQGIKFSGYGQDFFINLYTVRNKQRNVNICHKKLQKRIQVLFVNLRAQRRGKNLGYVIFETKNKYFQGLKLIQSGMKGCQNCGEMLRYCEKQNSFMPPILIFKEGIIRLYHESCLQQKPCFY